MLLLYAYYNQYHCVYKCRWKHSNLLAWVGDLKTLGTRKLGRHKGSTPLSNLRASREDPPPKQGSKEERWQPRKIFHYFSYHTCLHFIARIDEAPTFREVYLLTTSTLYLILSSLSLSIKRFHHEFHIGSDIIDATNDFIENVDTSAIYEAVRK